MLLQSCGGEPPSQELGSADSSFLDYLLDSNNCTIPWQQDRTASPIDLDDSLLLDSPRWSQVPTTQTRVRTFEQSWKEPSFQDFGADNSFQAFICCSPGCTFPWQQDWIASPEFFGSSSDANSQPYASKEQRGCAFPPAKKSGNVTVMTVAEIVHSFPMVTMGAAIVHSFQRRHGKPIVEVEERIAQSPLFSKGLTVQVSALSQWQSKRSVITGYAE